MLELHTYSSSRLIPANIKVDKSMVALTNFMTFRPLIYIMMMGLHYMLFILIILA